MTLDHAIALSLLADLPRIGLTDRLLTHDPELFALASDGLAAARRVRTAASGHHVHPLAWNDPAFPASLLAIPDCPPVLWYRGALPALRTPLVALVGSRAASAVALEVATQIAEGLARAGVTVVSGLARGIDSAAHRGALVAGRTVAVLGSGVDRIYPAEHRSLADQIAEDGLIVSEFPPGAAPLPFRFPLRNRIISGLSLAVVVIEASEKSGSLITAGCALEQGREVMAVPGNVLSGRNRGGHALIRDGARIVETADDILAELGLGAPASAGSNSSAVTTCDDPLLRRMTVGHPYDLDALAVATGLDLPKLLPRVSALELRGCLQRLEGGRFMRSR